MDYTIQKLKKDQNNIIKYQYDNYIKIDRKALLGYQIEKLKLFIYTCIAYNFNTKTSQFSAGHWKEFYKFINNSNTGAIFLIDNLTFIINRDEIEAVNQYGKIKMHEKLRLKDGLIWHSGIFKTINKKIYTNKINN